MDVIFLNTSESVRQVYFSRTIGPYKIAYWLRKHGYTSQVIDFITKFTEEQLWNMVTKFITPNTSIIGISTTFLLISEYQWPDGTTRRFPYHLFSLISRIKKEYPYIKIVAGGYKSDKIVDYGIIDATIMTYTGSNEDVFLEYLTYLKGLGPAPIGELKFPVVTGKDKEKHKPRMVYNTPRNKFYNIEQDDFKFTVQDGILPGEPLPLDVSRGCIFACRFCQYPHLGKGKLDYTRAMFWLEEELTSNYKNFGTTWYYFLDDTFNDTEIKMQEFYKMTQRLPFKINFCSYLRADLIHRFPDTAYLLQEAGLWGAYHGIESLHPSASKLVGKAWSGKAARDFIPNLYHNIWSGKIPQTLSFIVGLPKETKNDLFSTRDWFISNNLFNCQFNGLGVFGRNSIPAKELEDTLSEFDRNYEKYGFSFNETGWINETWHEKEAREFAVILNKELGQYSKVMSWQIPSLIWMGWSKEQAMTTSRRAVYSSHRPLLDNFTSSKHLEYYNLIMSL